MSTSHPRCPACHAEAVPGALACAQCGQELAQACPACGTPHGPTQKFCGECGSLLRHPSGRALDAAPGVDSGLLPLPPAAPAPAAPASERKQVTVLFADIKGSLEILAERDPEDANRVLDNTLHRMMDAVHHYQGTVSQARGDGIMALFGAPVAQEDHALRACFAAMRIQQSVAAYSQEAMRTEGVPVHVRVGLNSGEVVVRAIRNDIYTEYTAVGQTTHLAARMEQAAAPGTILATAQTARLVEGQVQVRPVGPIAVKGLAAPVEVCEILGAGPAQARLQARQSRMHTPFVNRDSERQQLRQALTAARSGSGRMLVLGGEAGVGKSRIVGEFVQHHGSDCLLLEIHPAHFGGAASLQPVIDMLRGYFGIDAGEPAAAVRKKATARVAERLPALLGQVAPLLDAMDALPADHAYRKEDAATRRTATVQAIAALVLGESQAQPVIAVFEDLQWADSLTRALLDELVARLAGAALLLLGCHRPHYRPPWLSAPGVQALAMAPLKPAATAALLQGILGDGADVPALSRQLHQRAGGNPFFVEEIIQSFVSAGALQGSTGAYRRLQPLPLTQIPATIESLLAARIDGLRPGDKLLLQQAAVIGERVPHGLLRRLTGLNTAELRARLARLRDADFLSEDAQYAEPVHVFKHALTQEVAYRELLHERRREIHARIVAAMELEFADRLPAVVDQIAHHALRGRLWDKALTYLRAAGGRAAERYAYLEAVALYEQALEVVAEASQGAERLQHAIDLRFELRNALQPLGERERMTTVLQDAAELAQQLGDPARIGWVQSYLTDHYWIMGQTREAAAAGEQALRIGSEQDDLALQVVTRLPLGLLHHTRGDYHQAMSHFGWNIGALQGALQESRFGLFVLPSAFSCSFQAWALVELGEHDQAMHHARRGIEIAERIRHASSIGYAYLGLGVVQLRHGDLPDAVASLQRALSASGFANSQVGLAYVAFHLGYALVLSGRVAEGLAMLEETVLLAETRRFVARHSLRLAYLAEAYALAGRNEEGEAVAARAIALAREHDERANEAHALVAAACVAQAQGRPDAARSALGEALALAAQLGMTPLQQRCRFKLGHL